MWSAWHHGYLFQGCASETPRSAERELEDASLSEFYLRQYLFPFHIKRRGCFEFDWVSSVTQKAANTFPRPLLDSLGDAVLEQGLVAAVLCQLLLQMALFFFCFPVCQGDTGVFVFVQCSWKQTTYLELPLLLIWKVVCFSQRVWYSFLFIQRDDLGI